MKWFTSDQHFGHAGVIKYCDRPYLSVDEMTAALIKIHNDTVKKNDTTYFLGDFSLNPKWVELVLPQLNGEKILIMGNHDATFQRKGREVKSGNMRKRYYLAGFAEIHLHMNLTLSNGLNVQMAHLPYATPDGTKYDKRHLDARVEDKGLILLHGHSHGRYKKFGRMIDVGIDAQGLKYLSEQDVIDLINDPREFIESPITEWYNTRPSQERAG